MKFHIPQDTIINSSVSNGFIIAEADTNSSASDSVFDFETNSLADSLILIDKADTLNQAVEPKLFTIQKLNSNKIEPAEHLSVNYDWITIHLLICIGLFAWVQIYYRSRLKQVFKAFAGARYLNQLSRDGNIFRERIAIPLLIIYFISFSLLIYLTITEILEINFADFSGLKLFSSIMLIIILIFFLKNFAVTFVGNVFKNNLILSEYILTNFVFNLTTGLLLIPVLIFSVYLPAKEMVYSAIIFWAIVFLYRIVREYFLALSYRKFSLFYRILYLCTLEIVPLLVLTKLGMSYLT